jgi:hypothetical protein
MGRDSEGEFSWNWYRFDIDFQIKTKNTDKK